MAWLMKRPWLTDDPAQLLSDLSGKILAYKNSNKELKTEFEYNSSLLYIYDSNELEGTLPGEDEPIIKQKIKEIYNTPPGPEINEPWLEDGNPKSEPQLLQHLQALRYVMLTELELSPDMIKAVHFQLMKNSVYENRPLRAGQCRTTACHAGMHQYPSPQLLEAGLVSICQEFEYSKKHWVQRASEFYSDFLMLHPFENGNGRTARLLLSFIARKNGITFPLVLSSGHDKSKSHCNRAIIRGYYDGRKELNTLVLVSVTTQLDNFLINKRFQS